MYEFLKEKIFFLNQKLKNWKNTFLVSSFVMVALVVAFKQFFFFFIFFDVRYVSEKDLKSEKFVKFYQIAFTQPPPSLVLQF